MELEDALLALGSTDPDVRAAALKLIAEHVLSTTAPSLARSSWGEDTVDEATHLMLLELCQRDRPMSARSPAAYLRMILFNACRAVYRRDKRRRGHEVLQPGGEDDHPREGATHHDVTSIAEVMEGQTIVPAEAFEAGGDQVVECIARHLIEVVAPSMSFRGDGIESTKLSIRELTDIYVEKYTMDELISSSFSSADPSAKELRARRDKINRRFSRARERLLKTLEDGGPEEQRSDEDLLLMHRFIQSVMSRSRAQQLRTSG